MKLERFKSIPVLTVLFLTCYVYYITLFVFIEDWISLNSSSGKLHAVIFTFLATYCLFSFFVCVLTDPGGVPSGYVPDVEENDDPNREFKRNAMHPRKCEQCNAYKPPRCHHCRVCRRCILKMDHHCKWTNNCIGYWNYKAFFILVLCAAAACIYSSGIMVGAIRNEWGFQSGVSRKLQYAISGAITVGLSIVFGSLLGWHIYLMAHNITTIEHYEAVRATWMAKKSGQRYHHPFDTGFYKNVILVLGPNMLKWLCPTAVSHLKDGTSFRST